MNLRKLIYVMIGIVCISSIAIGIYSQYGSKGKTNNTNSQADNTSDSNTYVAETEEEIKSNFNNMFDNKLNIGQYDTTSITKSDTSKEIVYTAYQNKDSNDNYEVDLNIPVINIKSDLANTFNSTTQEEFANKATEVLKNKSNNYMVYTISYTGYINGNIMSIIIKSTLKEGSSAQRVMVETYNYNLKTGEKATIDDAIQQRGVSTSDVDKKINTQIQEAIEEANDIQVTGYEVYTRDLNDDMYKIENTENYFLGSDGALYIVYAYGNKEFTSEIDIIEI